MKKALVATVAVLLFVIVLTNLVFAAPALASGRETPLTGTETRYFGVPARHWAADGYSQVRDLPLTGAFTFSGAGVTLAGPETQMTNAVLYGDGNGITWGMVTYRNAASGVACAGPVVGKITNALATLTVVAPCSDGAVLRGTLQDREIYPAGATPPTWVRSDFNGVLLSPD